MALTFRRWGPTTCSCKLFMQFDDALSDVEVVFTYLSHPAAQQLANEIRGRRGVMQNIQPDEEVCPVHQALSGSALFNTVTAENIRKNMTMFIARGVSPEITGAQYLWEYDADRVLQVRFPRLSETTRREIQSACDIQFGPGLVVVN